MKTHLINRYNVYKGGKKLIGVAGELTLPEVTNLTDSTEGAGTGGTMDIPVVGLIEELELEVGFDSLCDDIFSIIGGSVDIMIAGALQGADAGTGATKFANLNIAVRGVVKKFAPGTVKAGGKMDSKVTIGLNYYKIMMDGKTKMEIDRFNGVFSVNGVDLLADVRNMC